MTLRQSIRERIARPPRIVAVSERYSRFIRLMKLVLPLSAAALVLAVVAWPYLYGRDGDIPFSFATVWRDMDGKLFVTNARYLGSDGKDQPFTLTAEVVTKDDDNPDVLRLTKPKADILLTKGAWLALTADAGTLFRNDEKVSLEGAVNFFSDLGYEFRTERAEIDLKASRAHGDAPIEGQGPLGVLSADSFRLEDKGRTVHFEGRVRMILYPKSGA